jgi:hypothetical protein
MTEEKAPVLRPLSSPPKELVDALAEQLGPELLGHPGIVKMGGLPRALERYLNAHAKEKDAKRLEHAAKELRETLAFRDASGLDAPVTDARASDESIFKGTMFWPGVQLGKTADGFPLAYFRYGEQKPREMMKHLSEDELRAFYLDWMELLNSLQVEASGGPGTRSCDWRASVEIHDMAGLSWQNVHFPAIMMSGKVMGLGTKHYKDNLAKSFIINAPSWFGAMRSHAAAKSSGTSGTPSPRHGTTAGTAGTAVTGHLAHPTPGTPGTAGTAGTQPTTHAMSERQRARAARMDTARTGAVEGGYSVGGYSVGGRSVGGYSVGG